MMISLPWMIEAAKHVGQKEVPGPGFNAWIKNMWLSLPGGSWYWSKLGKGDDSLLPWCGGFWAFVMQACGISCPARYASAKAWADWGTRLSVPVYGCLVVFSRAGGGHVGAVMGVDRSGRLMVLGANQKDMVRVDPFDRARVAAYIWPPGQPFVNTALPVMDSSASSSTNEA